MPKTKKTKVMAKTIEEKYSSKELRDHIYDIPDTYVGSTSYDNVDNWIWDPISKRIIRKNVSFIEGFHKIFDEVLVNSIDQYHRMLEYRSIQDKIRSGEAEETRDVTLDMSFKLVKNIKVNIDRETNEISVENDGTGIPIIIHKVKKIYVPQLIFGVLLTGENYDQNQMKTVGGKNGLGAKLANIFSTEFTITTVDCERKLKYVQKFSKNMTVIGKPVITSCNDKPYTKITYKPELKKFGMKDFDDDTYYTMVRRVYDIAACTDKDCKVYLNHNKVEVNDFESYTGLYLGEDEDKVQKVYHKHSDRWEIVATLSAGDHFQHVSFVNGIFTDLGGKHVDHVVNKLSEALAAKISTKKTVIQPKFVKDNLWLFVKSTVENPQFTSQTKRQHTTPINKFGSKFDITTQLINKIMKIGIVKRVKELAQFRESRQLSRTDGKLVSRINVNKLEDAPYAKSKSYIKRAKCILMITEGDSAKTFASSCISALSEEERRYYGIFPIRGKLLNIRSATPSQITKNKEIASIKQIIGFREGVDYSVDANFKRLRYGKIMIMSDADVDGIHIEGLIINFIHIGWQSLIDRGFLTSFVTPIVRAWKDRKSGARIIKCNEQLFYTETEFNKWKKKILKTKAKSTVKSLGWNVRYYKGLGTNTANEARELQKNNKVITYTRDDTSMDISDTYEMNRTDYSMDLAFSSSTPTPSALI